MVTIPPKEQVISVSVTFSAVIQVAQYQDIRPSVTLSEIEVPISEANDTIKLLYKTAQNEVGLQVYAGLQPAIVVAAEVNRKLATYQEAAARLRTIAPAYIWLSATCPDIARRASGDVLDANEIWLKEFEAAKETQLAEIDEESFMKP